MSLVRVDGAPLSTNHIEQIAQGARVQIGRRILIAAGQQRHRLDELIDQRRLIYGVTTGYGPLAGRHIDPSRSGELQRNLIYHLASGTGPPLERRAVRAIMAVRLNTLAQGYSAVRPETLEMLAAWLNADIVPIVPARGTVGASGDLTPLAHIALALMGEAEVCDNGQRRPAASAITERGWQPLKPEAKDALGLVNGTAAMTGIAALNGQAALRSVDLALRCTVAYAECLQGQLEAWDPAFGVMRPHSGQQEAHERLLKLAAGSQRLIPGQPRYLRSAVEQSSPVHDSRSLLQDPYTIRCAPQLFGAVLDVIEFHNSTVDREINSVTDNPVFDPEADAVLHGGNFYGQHVAFAADSLTNAVIKTAVHSERMVARLTDENQNGELPAFLQGLSTGLHSGLMGAQVTASAIVAELRSLAHPASIQSVPTNANNQDVVTMGTIAARKTAEVLTQTRELQSIAAITMAQGVDLVGSDGFAPATVALRDWVRDYSPAISTDRPLYGDIERVGQALHDAAGQPIDRISNLDR
ncbi:aromatic amino acid lyase [Wenzhouxiangella sp. AB-CW3]|uniref:HAL/PAL/TAL family ammonia-lyase n=1 Tax=Wenzhouxiangella sp. AB-CW3 TaxID=2771012 RepID=UPI00168A65EF|nr:aromatic amino acid ammonia-lyase [Wenzhouxiangella sp. AB-CW3]QOC22889.1 aromatic amino acid lyase [Wenzhouxiangella sp. AB-CW3]